MERMIKSIKKIAFLSLVLGLVISCRDPLDLMAKLEDDVKAANDLYLEIVSITPEENAQGINPGAEIRIEFDRAIDMATLEDNFSLVDSEGVDFESDIAGKTLSFSFNESTNILTIAADPFLDGLIEYKMDLLDHIEGTDGSVLREPVSRSFKTSDAPRGGFRILEDYTNSETATVDVEITSQGATYYILATSEAGLDSAGWQEITSGIMIVEDVPIAGTQGTNTLYLRLRDGSVSEAGSATKSNIETATVVYDTVAPVIDFGDSYTYSNNVSSASLSADVVDANGISQYLWEDTDSEGINISAPSSLTTTASKGTDGTYSLTLTATDPAGNSSSAELYYMVDSDAPILNIAEKFNTPSSTDLDLDLTAVDDDSGIDSYSWKVLTKAGDYTLSAISAEDRRIRIADVGDYTFRVTAYDKCGNYAYKDVLITCSDDLPEVSIPKSIYYQKSQITINATAVDATTSINWTSEPTGVVFGSPNSASTTVSAPANGTYKITLTGVNGAGSASATSTFIWDNAAPTVSISSSTLYANSSNTSPTLYATAADNTGGSGIVSYKWTQTGGSGTMSFGSSNSLVTSVSMSQDATNYEATLTVKDNAGNETVVTRNIVRDTIAPSPPSVGTISVTSATAPTYTLSFGSGGINYYRNSINGSSWSYSNDTTPTLSLPYGGSTVSFQGRDLAGNWSSSNSQTTVVYPTKGPYPSSGGTLTGDMAWPYYSGKYYTVFVGSDSRNVTTVLGSSYRPYPYVDSSEISKPPYTTTVYWKVVVYTRGLPTKLGYTYTTYTTLPSTGAYTMVVPGGKY